MEQTASLNPGHREQVRVQTQVGNGRSGITYRPFSYDVDILSLLVLLLTYQT